MPKLPTYSADIQPAQISGGRRATAEDFGDGSGLIEAGHHLTATAGAYLQDAQESEARTALISSTQIRAKYARRLDDAALSGEDVGAIKQEMTDELSKVGENFSTKRGAEQLQLYTANSEIMFDEKANAINVHRAFVAAKTQGNQFLVDSSKIIQGNPGYLAVAEKGVDDFLATFRISPEQKAELGDRLKKDLNMAAAVSAARIDPAGTAKRLDAGEWNLLPEQRSTALDKARTEERMARVETEYARADKERQLRDDANKARDEAFTSIVGGTFNRRAVMDDPRFAAHPELREHVIVLAKAWAKEQAGEERKSDVGTKTDLFLRIISPEGTQGKIYTTDEIVKAVQDGKLNTTDANWLTEKVSAQRDENGRTFYNRLSGRMSVIKSAMASDVVLKNTPGLMEPVMDALISKAENKANEMRKAGQSPNNLLDSTSKDYFFTPGLIKQTADEVKRQVLNSAPKMNAGQEIEKDGVTWVYNGGDPAKPTSYQKKKTLSEEDVTAADRDAWLAATRGALKPGQSEAEAIAAWKAKR